LYCTISKIDFLEVWHAARKKGMTPEIIKSAWAKSGILLGDLRVIEPQIVLAQLPGGQEVSPSLAESLPLTPERPIPTNKQFKTPGDLLAF
jgi:hypothetical protein